MSKLSVVLYYWIFILLLMLGARLFGLAEDGTTIFVIVAVATILYIGLGMIYATTNRAARSSQQMAARKKKPPQAPAAAPKKRKK